MKFYGGGGADRDRLTPPSSSQRPYRTGPATGPVSIIQPRLADALPTLAGRVTWFVPGRIEVLGKHTDYAGGRSLLAAVDAGVTITATKTSNPYIRVTSTAVNDSVDIPLSTTHDRIPGHWSGYPVATVARMVANFGDAVTGADITIDSNLPLASGMSSSSAVIVGLSRAIIDLGGLDKTPVFRRYIGSPETLAAYLACVENGMSFGELTGHRGVGTFGGSEDHTAMLCGDENRLVQYRFCPVKRERSVPIPPGYTFVVAVSGVLAEKTGAQREAYNRASLSTREIVQLWNEDSGRVDTYLADAVRAGYGAVERLQALVSHSNYLTGRLNQFVAESEQIIPEAGDALADGALEVFGELVDQSQRLAETGLQNQVPQTVSLQRQAREMGAVAASAFGAGFGGSVWALVPAADAPDFAAQWMDRHLRTYPYLEGKASTIITRPCGRARRLEWSEA